MPLLILNKYEFYKLLVISACLFLIFIISGSCKKEITTGTGNANINFFGGPTDYATPFTINTNDGGYLETGNDAGNTFTYLLKMNAHGGIQWSKKYKIINCSSAVETPDAGYIICGTALNPANSVIMKTDASGDTLWIKNLNINLSGKFSFYIHPGKLSGDGVGSYYLSGYYEKTDHVNIDNFYLFLIKVNGNGATLWAASYLNNNIYNPATILNLLVDSKGGIVFAYTSSSGMYMNKVDSSTRKTTAHCTLFTQPSGAIEAFGCSRLQANPDGSYQTIVDESNDLDSAGNPGSTYYHHFYDLTISKDLSSQSSKLLDSLALKANFFVPFLTESDGGIIEAIPTVYFNQFGGKQGQYIFIIKNAQKKILTVKSLPGWPYYMKMDNYGNYFISGLAYDPASDARGTFTEYIDKNGNIIH